MDTNFIDQQTKIVSSWLNDINDNAYKAKDLSGKRGFVNVRSAPYNATGDGVTDDGPAITSAINAVIAAGGGTVFFPKPPNKYLVNSTLFIGDGVSLMGEGIANRWRSSRLPTVIDFRGSGAAITNVPATNATADTSMIYGLHIDGTNSAAACNGIVLNAGAAGSSIEGFFMDSCAVTNFPGNQIRHIGNVFDTTYRRVSALNPNRASSNTVEFSGALPSQITFDDCWLSPYTAGTWACYAPGTVDLRFYGGTVAPYDNTTGANGVFCYGGLHIFGTHFENRNSSQSTNIGILYYGQNGAFISPSICSTFGIGVQIGNTDANAALGWTIAGNVSSNNVAAGGFDIKITNGASRNGTILGMGNTATPTIRNNRLLVDGVDDVASLYRGSLDHTRIFAPDGTAGNPSISFINSTGTGMRNVAGDMFVDVAGINVAAIQSTGFRSVKPVFPGKDDGTYQGTAAIYAGAGVPSNANGANGNFYFRSDNPGGASQRLYVKSGGVWIGIL